MKLHQRCGRFIQRWVLLVAGAAPVCLAPPATAATGPFAPPAGIVLTASYGDVIVAWNAVTGAAGYDVMGTSDPSQAPVTIVTLSKTSLGYRHKQAASTAVYYYQVVAIDARGTRAPSALVKFTAPVSTATPTIIPPSGAASPPAPVLAGTAGPPVAAASATQAITPGQAQPSVSIPATAIAPQNAGAPTSVPGSVSSPPLPLAPALPSATATALSGNQTTLVLTVGGSVAAIGLPPNVVVQSLPAIPSAISPATPRAVTSPAIAAQRQPPPPTQQVQFSMAFNMSNAFNQWVQQSVAHHPSALDGAFLFLGPSNRVVRADQWTGGSIDKVDLPPFDATAATPLYATVTLKAVSFAPNPALVNSSIPVAGPSRMALATASFRLSSTASINLTSVMQVGALSLASGGHGGTLAFSVPGQTAVVDQLAIAFQNGGHLTPRQTVDFTLNILSPDLKRILATVTLQNCLVTNVAIPKLEKGPAPVSVTVSYADASLSFAPTWP